MDIDEAKFQKKPYYPWQSLSLDDDDDLSEKEQHSRLEIILEDDGY